MTRTVSTNNDNPGFLNPDFSRLKNNACLVLTEPGDVQEEACGPGVPCITWRHNTDFNHINNVFHQVPDTSTHQTQQQEVPT